MPPPPRPTQRFFSAKGTKSTTSAPRKSPNAITTRAKSLAFRIFTEAMARKNGGDPNFKYGWYAGSREQIKRIVSHGFSSSEMRSMIASDKIRDL
ncbi:unnamed protein product [Brassica oleracea var. botrytis]